MGKYTELQIPRKVESLQSKSSPIKNLSKTISLNNALLTKLKPSLLSDPLSLS